MITELCPIYNRFLNPRAGQYRLLLGINYDAMQDADTIRRHLSLLSEYEKKGLFGYSLPVHVFSAMEEEAEAQGCNCSELLQRFLEDKLGSKVACKLQSGEEELRETNLVTTKQYARLHGKSREQIKAYCLQNNRIHGTTKIGRDWVMPKDTGRFAGSGKKN